MLPLCASQFPFEWTDIFSLPIVEGAVQAQYKGTMDGFLWQFFHFLLKPGLNSQFVPLNNSGCFIYFEFSLHSSCRSWPPPILTRLVALKMHPHHPYMYKGSSRDFLCYGSALALLSVCSEMRREYWDVCILGVCVFCFVSMSPSVCLRMEEVGWGRQHLCCFIIPVFHRHPKW